jgi:hypothetical protein
VRRFHIALSVADIRESIADYTRRLAVAPDVVVAGEYALWRTETLNFSIRRSPEQPGALRHLGWEDAAAPGFSAQTDVNGVVWEHFCQQAQVKEIQRLWPDAATIFCE